MPKADRLSAKRRAGQEQVAAPREVPGVVHTPHREVVAVLRFSWLYERWVPSGGGYTPSDQDRRPLLRQCDDGNKSGLRTDGGRVSSQWVARPPLAPRRMPPRGRQDPRRDSPKSSPPSREPGRLIHPLLPSSTRSCALHWLLAVHTSGFSQRGNPRFPMDPAWPRPLLIGIHASRYKTHTVVGHTAGPIRHMIDREVFIHRGE